MNNLNKVMLIGNLTRDPEIRQTSKGSSVTDLGIAVNRVYTNDAGERQEDVTYVDVTLWNRNAENAAKYLKKGEPVFIEGRLQLDAWQDKESGQARQRLRVVAERIQFLGSKPSGSSDPNHQVAGNEGEHRQPWPQQQQPRGGGSRPPRNRQQAVAS